jgi:hypothetical protein
MKRLLIVIHLLIAVSMLGQQQVIEKIIPEICDSLYKTEKPLEKMSYQESRNLIRTILVKNYSDWVKELNEFKKMSGNSKTAEYDFDQYFQHLLQLDCQNFRIIDKKLDSYLSEKRNLRPLYLITKEFIIGLEDNLKNNDLKRHINNSLKGTDIENILNESKVTLNKCKRTTTLNILLVYVNGYTYRVRYFDFLSNEPEYQIDIIFKDDSDLLIDNLTIKNKKQLMIELKERIEFNEKVESGEIKIPPPPAPPPVLKND